MPKQQGGHEDWPTGAGTLDDVDWALLRILSAEPRLTNKAMAQRLGLAESTCAYRLRALRDRGVLLGSSIRLNYAALGYTLQAVIKVRLGSHDEQGVSTLFDDLVATPGVLQVFHVAGADDFLVHVAVRDAEALRDLILRGITVHRVVRQTETHLVFATSDGIGVTGGDRPP